MKQSDQSDSKINHSDQVHGPEKIRNGRERNLRETERTEAIGGYANKRNRFIGNGRQILSPFSLPSRCRLMYPLFSVARVGFEGNCRSRKLNMVYSSGRGKCRFPNTVAPLEREFASVKWQRVMSRCRTKEKQIRYNVTRVIKRQSCWLARERKCSCALWTGYLFSWNRKFRFTDRCAVPLTQFRRNLSNRCRLLYTLKLIFLGTLLLLRMPHCALLRINPKISSDVCCIVLVWRANDTTQKFDCLFHKAELYSFYDLSCCYFAIPATH